MQKLQRFKKKKRFKKSFLMLASSWLTMQKTLKSLNKTTKNVVNNNTQYIFS